MCEVRDAQTALGDATRGLGKEVMAQLPSTEWSQF